jgi:hypothetical protein
MRSRRRILTILYLILGTGAPLTAKAPEAISPGSDQQLTAIAVTCPTFSWTAAEGNDAVDLVVYALDEERQPTLARIRQRLPGSAASWTPGLDSCLERGRTYAWSIRGIDDELDTDWSPARFFQIAAGPTVEEVEAALQTLRAFLAANHWEEGASDTGSTSDQTRGHAQPVVPRPSRFRGLQTRALLSSTVGESPTEPMASSAAPDPSTEGRSLTVDSNIELGPSANLFKNASVFLWSDGFTGSNLGLGRKALDSNTTGTQNLAVGAGALQNNTGGYRNVAVGAFSFLGNGGNYVGNVAVGAGALEYAYGSRNVAIGAQTLQYLSGNDNIAIGYRAGRSRDFADNTIFIGDAATHQETFVAGKVAIGTTVAPTNQLVVKEQIDGAASLANHVALIENTDTQGSGDVLALKIGEASPLETDNNFITFFAASSAIGAIEGAGAGGGISFNSSSGDFAEYLKKLDPAEEIGAGDVVGMFGDRLSRSTDRADRILVVSTAPIVTGNDPGTERRDEYEKVAFVGQVPVNTVGPVAVGDLLVASTREDGTAHAISSAALRLGDLPRLVGRALEGSESPDVKKIRALVGIADYGSVAALVEREGARAEALERRLEQLEN